MIAFTWKTEYIAGLPRDKLYISMKNVVKGQIGSFNVSNEEIGI